MKTYLLLFSLLASSASGPASAAESGFVGHGGHGVEKGGKLFVRDLVTHGVEERPYFGEKADAYYLARLPAESSLGFSYPRELLARKLTDLDAVGLGQVLLLSLRSYQWLLVDEPLTPVTDPDDPVELPEGARLYQIGNRLGTTIRIQADAWKRLDDANRAALLVHELVYSLVRLSPINRNQRCLDQLPRTAREITGLFFTSAYFQGNPSLQYHDLASQLSIPETLVSVKDARRPPSWTLSLGKKKRDFPFGGKLSPQDFLSRFCDEARSAKVRAGSDFLGVGLTVELKSYNTCRLADPTGDPAMIGRQQYLEVSSGAPNQSHDYFDSASEQSCEEAFGRHLRRAQEIIY